MQSLATIFVISSSKAMEEPDSLLLLDNYETSAQLFDYWRMC